MSIQVGVRVRPFNAREKERESECVIQMPGQNQTKIKDEQGKERTLHLIIAFGHMMAIKFLMMVTYNQLMKNMPIKKSFRCCWKTNFRKCMGRISLLFICIWTNRFRKIIFNGWLWSK